MTVAQEAKSSVVKGYVEERLKRRVADFADEHGMTESQATRFLVLQGLRVDRRLKQMQGSPDSAIDAEAAHALSKIA